jgi:predicted ATP-dependent protease
MIDVSGGVIGQVNALAVYQIGEFSFGRPARITAETYMGKQGVVNIERESELSGSTHDKGVLILSGYLGRTFAQHYPLSLSISITFEQSYFGIDGDSASSTELYAILSSLADMPIKQGIAVTGSVKRHERRTGCHDSGCQRPKFDAQKRGDRCRQTKKIPHLSGLFG